MDDIDAEAIDRFEHEDTGRYVYRLAGAEAELAYRLIGLSAISIEHTTVPDALRGRSIGQSLVRRAINDARREGREVEARCPFAKAQMQRHPEW